MFSAREAYKVHEDKDAVYVGDGVYLSNDGYQEWLFTYDGNNVLDAIALEYHTLVALSEILLRKYPRLFKE